MTLSRIDELRADQALWGLTDQESEELGRLERELGLSPDPSWERAAATFVALQSRPGSAPDSVVRRLQAGAVQHQIDTGLLRFEDIVAAARSGARPAGGQPASAGEVTRVRAADQGARLAWLAAAALLLCSLWLAWQQWAPPPSPATLREALLRSGQPVLRVDWSGEVGQLEGDVVWNARAQEGYLRFRGLPANDPSRERYQLWVFDQQRDEKHPVDGGLFDIPDGAGEVVVPIRAGVKVHEAAAFAVTVEQPDGVVVSKREQIVALAR